jgi:drug/metabolite transporter (DMT)-like permease
MIIGTLIAKKIYSIQKYFFVTMLIIGISVFAYADGKSKKETNFLIIGYILVGVSLLMDGLLGAVQDVLRKVKKPSAIHFMFYVNAWSVPFLIIALIISRETFPFITFCTDFPIVNLYLVIFLTFGCLGQYFMASLISSFGSLTNTLTMTTRKFFTVLFSVFFFNNSFNEIQWFATFLIFIALLLNVLFGKQKSTKTDEIFDEHCKDKIVFVVIPVKQNIEISNNPVTNKQVLP